MNMISKVVKCRELLDQGSFLMLSVKNVSIAIVKRKSLFF